MSVIKLFFLLLLLLIICPVVPVWGVVGKRRRGRGAPSSVSLMLGGQTPRCRICGPAVVRLRGSPLLAVGVVGPVSIRIQGGSDGVRERRCWQ